MANSQGGLLAVFAHPDDEVFAAGGVMAQAAANGMRVVLVCATRGEAGEISDPALATRENLGDVRESELRAACAALSLGELRFLGFRDSGMAGTPENDDPRSLHRADPAEATRRLVRIIREVKPDLVITHDPTGSYGHPDHIASYRHTTAAFDAAGDGTQFVEAGEPWQPARLFYDVTPRSFFVWMREQMLAAGVDTNDWDSLPIDQLGYDDDQIDVEVDVSAQVDRKLAAFDAHRTQFGDNSELLRIPEEARRAMLSREYFIQARPERTRGAAKSLDLFEHAVARAGSP